MLVGLLAKLVVALVLILAAVGVYVGGQKFVSLLDRSAPPVSAVRQRSDPMPRALAETTAVPARRPPPVAVLAPPVAARRTSPAQADLAKRRGALRPGTQPHQEAPRPQPAQPRAPPPPARVDSPPPSPSTAAVPSPLARRRPQPVDLDGPQTVLVDLRLGRLVSRTVVAYRDGEEALIPLADFFELAEIGYRADSGGVFRARLEPQGENIRIVAGADSVQVGRRRLSVAPSEVILRDGTVYMGTSPLGEMLRLQIVVDWPDLSVTVADPDSLPVARRLRRDRMRALLAERNGAAPDTVLGPGRTKWDGLVFDYNVAIPISDNLVGGSSYQFSMGGQVEGGALEVGVRSLGALESGEAEFAATWRGVWIDKRWVKQLTLGTATLTGPRYSGIRGVAVTNSPYIRPTYVGQLDYYGSLEPGWQLEAYSGAQLVAFDSIGPSGDYSISLPVGYGENAVEFVAYGPTGQVRRFNQTYRVVSQQLPDKDFEYGIAAGQCVTTLCNGALNADVHYGLSRRVTVRGGLEGYSRDSLPDLLHPYALATGLVGNALTLEGEVVGNGWLRGAARLEPSLDLRLGIGYTTFEEVDRPVIAPQGRRSQWLFDGFLRPVPSLSSLYLQGMAELDRGVNHDVTRARLQASVQADGVRLYPYARFERFAAPGEEATSASFLGLSAYAFAHASWGAALKGVWVRGDIETGGGGGLNLASATVAKTVGPELQLQVGAGWHRDVPGTTFRVSLVSYLPTLQATTTAVAPTTGGGAVLQTVQGTLVYDTDQRRVTTGPNPGIQRSGVSGTVFVDENANGVREADEPGVRNVRIVVGSHTARSDSVGRYHVWDVPAFEPVRIQIDSTTLDNPLYVPAFTSALLEPPPNSYRRLDLPLVTGAVLEGRVLLDGAPFPNVTLVLTNTTNGKTTSLATFSDGSFYVLGVKPGTYTLEVDGRDLAAQRLVGTVLQITAQPNTPDQLSNLVVELRRAPK